MKRREAKALGLLYYNTGKPCRSGHLADRIVSKGICRQCALEHSKRPDQKIKRAAYAKTNKSLEQRARYRQTEQWREVNRIWSKRYRLSHLAQHVGHQITTDFKRPANRHALAEHWPAMNALYAEAQAKGLTIDHVVPLRGATVSGLHVIWNLQMLTREENSRKNHFIPEV
jgi:hypothetical protein